MKLALLAVLALGAARQAAAAAWNENVFTQYGIVQGETSNDVRRLRNCCLFAAGPRSYQCALTAPLPCVKPRHLAGH